MKIEIDLDTTFGAFCALMAKTMGRDAARAYLRKLADNDRLWEAFQYLEEHPEVLADAAADAALGALDEAADRLTRSRPPH